MKIFYLFFLALLISCKSTSQNYLNINDEFDLAIKNVTVFDSHSKNLLYNKTILIAADSIAKVVDSSQKVIALEYIEGNGRLVTPGFIDTHMHLSQIFGDGDKSAPEFIESNDSYRRILGEQYLSYGTTTIMDMGMPERWIDTALVWQKNPLPGYPNIFITGGAIISDDERETNMNHVEVMGPMNAKEKVQEYSKLGLEHSKLYWRLRTPEMKAVIEEARAQGVNTFGHIQFRTTINEAMDLGLRDFEHFFTLVSSVFDYDKHWEPFMEKYKINRSGTSDEFAADMMLMFDYIKGTPELKTKLDKLISRMALENTSMSTTINVLASTANRADFYTSFDSYPVRSAPYLPNDTYENKMNTSKAFNTTMEIVKDAYEKGMKLRIGTDCKHGGKAMLSELTLLYKADFKVQDILQIATLNGAEAMNIQAEYGSIEKGKKADLIIFDKSPFDDYKNFVGTKTVVKGGRVFKPKRSLVQTMLQIIHDEGMNSGIEWFQNFKENPLNEIEMNEVGYELLISNKVDDAIKIFTLNSEKFPKTKELYDTLNEENINLEGLYLLNQGNFEQAIKIFEYNVEKYPSSANAYANLGEAYSIYGNKKLSIKNYEKALEIEPENKDIKEKMRKIRDAIIVKDKN